VLERCGLIERDIENAWLAAGAEPGPRGRVLVACRRGHRVAPARQARAAVPLHQPPPVASERLALTGSGHVRYALKTPYRDGATHIVGSSACVASRSTRAGAAAATSGSSPASSRPRSSRRSARTSSARRRRRQSGRSGHGRRRCTARGCELDGAGRLRGPLTRRAWSRYVPGGRSGALAGRTRGEARCQRAFSDRRAVRPGSLAAGSARRGQPAAGSGATHGPVREQPRHGQVV